MSREAHVRFSERLGGQFPQPRGHLLGRVEVFDDHPFGGVQAGPLADLLGRGLVDGQAAGPGPGAGIAQPAGLAQGLDLPGLTELPVQRDEDHVDAAAIQRGRLVGADVRAGDLVPHARHHGPPEPA